MVEAHSRSEPAQNSKARARVTVSPNPVAIAEPPVKAKLVDPSKRWAVAKNLQPGRPRAPRVASHFSKEWSSIPRPSYEPR